MNSKHQKQLQEQTKQLKHLPGVYQMKDKEGKILYVGKSIDIQRRVASYFTPSAKRSRKIERMIYHIYDYDVFYTETELDALLLECRWIKQYKPFYNTALTRQHKYVYFDLYDKVNYRIKASKSARIKGQKGLGPFTNYRLALIGMKYIGQSRPYLTCEFKSQKTIEACYAYQFKVCPGFCQSKERPSIEDLMEKILGAKSNILKEIDEKMQQHIEYLEFERAAEMLRQKRGVQYLKAIYGLLNEIQKKGTYIGVMPESEGIRNKYYLIIGGRLKASQVAYKSEEKDIIKTYKELVRQASEEDTLIGIEEIDEVLIIESFRRKKMKQICV